MRIAVIVNSFPKLSETFIVNKVIGLRETGADVSVWVHSTEADANAFRNRLGSDRLPFVHEAPFSHGLVLGLSRILRDVVRSPRVVFRLLSRVTRLNVSFKRALRSFTLALPLARSNYDLIHFEMSGLAVTYLDALPLLGSAKLVCSCRGAAEQITPLISPNRAASLGKVFAKMDAVHCVSNDMQKTVQIFGLREEKSFVNHPAIDVESFRRKTVYPQKNSGTYHIASVGRLHWKKGFEFALLGVRELKRVGEKVSYHIVGNGQEEEKLRFLVSSLGLDDVVSFHGAKAPGRVREMLETVDVFLLPSLSEGLSNAALEAMAMEIPVVSTNVGGMDEVITDGVDGILVPPMNPVSMAEKTRVLLEDPHLRARIGQAGRQTVCEHFSVERQTAKFQSWYETLIDDRTK